MDIQLLSRPARSPLPSGDDDALKALLELGILVGHELGPGQVVVEVSPDGRHDQGGSVSALERRCTPRCVERFLVPVKIKLHIAQSDFTF